MPSIAVADRHHSASKEVYLLCVPASLMLVASLYRNGCLVAWERERESKRHICNSQTKRLRSKKNAALKTELRNNTCLQGTRGEQSTGGLSQYRGAHTSCFFLSYSMMTCTHKCRATNGPLSCGVRCKQRRQTPTQCRQARDTPRRSTSPATYRPQPKGTP